MIEVGSFTVVPLEFGSPTDAEDAYKSACLILRSGLKPDSSFFEPERDIVAENLSKFGIVDAVVSDPFCTTGNPVALLVVRIGASLSIVIKDAITSRFVYGGDDGAPHEGSANESVMLALRRRRELHLRLRGTEPAGDTVLGAVVLSEVAKILNWQRSLKGAHRLGAVPKIEYAFTFFLAELDRLPGTSAGESPMRLLQALVDPWMTGIDDGIAYRHDDDEPIDDFADNEIQSVSSSKSRNHELFASWSSLLLCVQHRDGEAPKPSAEICTVIALELIMQCAWNRASTVSRSIRHFLSESLDLPLLELSEYHWRVLSELTIVEGSLVPAISFHERAMFAVMCQTSQIEEEVARLRRSIDLLERVLSSRRAAEEKHTEWRLQVGLSIIAVLQIVGVFVATPVIKNQAIGWIVVVLLALSIAALLVPRRLSHARRAFRRGALRPQ